jgi:hypothetical protein
VTSSSWDDWLRNFTDPLNNVFVPVDKATKTFSGSSAFRKVAAWGVAECKPLISGLFFTKLQKGGAWAGATSGQFSFVMPEASGVAIDKITQHAFEQQLDDNDNKVAFLKRMKTFNDFAAAYVVGLPTIMGSIMQPSTVTGSPIVVLSPTKENKLKQADLNEVAVLVDNVQKMLFL